MLDMRYLSGVRECGMARAAPSRNTRCEIGCSWRAVLRPAIQVAVHVYQRVCQAPYNIHVAPWLEKLTEI